MESKKVINSLFAVYFVLVSAVFILLGLYFFRINFFIMGIVSAFFLVYNRKNAEGKRFIDFVIEAVICVFLFCLSSFFSGLVSYRPIYTYEHYKNSTAVIEEIFPAQIPSNADNKYFAVLMEDWQYESVVLSFAGSNDDIENLIKEFSGSYLLFKSADEEFVYNDEIYEFPSSHSILPEEMKNSSGEYCFYYSEISHSHLTGIVVNQEHDYICYFDIKS